jgi:hypothetical protein
MVNKLLGHKRLARKVDGMRRPGPLLWLKYAFGGSLPPGYAEWVLHDTTAGTWVLRHIARVLVVIAVPVAAILIWLPASIGLRGLTAFVCAACAVLLTAILSNDMTERRLHRAGYEWGLGERIRAQRAGDAQRSANQRRRERIAARRQRRA